ncbi:protein stum isoform X2 [Belonocnema kinseyi]|uniref:protein stum isoform X2 n=1 Tax=Belonocnema kinseyi TaxID=2817044 RepID=UPI00143DCF7F|nr:protein stum isoform X2 [Belonocnema kinseyi]
MRRIDPDNHGPRTGPPPFRVLSGGAHCLLSPSPPSPPPSRAPEPYKVGPSASSYTRAHRRSSFVIIAETRPITPDSRSPSPPSLATGRVSPFRGRGFKGPLPHAQSRPQSPDNFQRRRSTGSRSDRRVSVSQQNSPKRSQIPQPTRSRSISLTKRNEKKASPKFGRRANSKNNLVVPNNWTLSRRPSTKRPSLPPIQGTPTKPSEKPDVKPRAPQTQNLKPSPQKRRRNSLIPTPKIVSKPKKSSNEQKSSSTEGLASPSKIPLRRGSISNNKSASTQSLSSNKPVGPPPSSKFAKSLERVVDKNSKKPIQKTIKKPEGKSLNNSSLQVPQQNKNLEKEVKKLDGKSGSNIVEQAAKILENDLGLVELLKKSSEATGTKSVVNSTTTTAVQPLQIDANAKNSAKETAAKIGGSENQKKEELPAKKEGNNSADGKVKSKVESSADVKNADQKTARVQETNHSTKAQIPNVLGTPISTPESKSTTPDDVVIIGGNSSGNMTQSMIKHFGKNADESGNEPPQPTNGKVLTNISDTNAKLKSNDKSGEPSTQMNPVENSKERTKAEMEILTVSNNPSNKKLDGQVQGTEHRKTDSKDSDLKSVPTSTNGSESVTARVIDLANTSSVNSVEQIRDQGSGVSLKSSAGKSSDSVSSIRSTDTGVSLNTVRGVSSAREKKGVHSEKRPQEIETLSGNIGHPDRNGETNILAAPGNGEGAQEKLVSRWKKSLGRYCKCWPGMRCLACRRDPKVQLWPRSQPRTISKAELTPGARGNTDKGPGRWSRLRKACRCSSWKENKWCMRRTRVAPAESTPCCPPERRFGALCSRLFSNCKCKRSENIQQRRKSMRAKHSITSIVAPPISEELRPRIPDVLVEHNSLMRGAIPCLPVPLAWFCLAWNLIIPGSET